MESPKGRIKHFRGREGRARVEVGVFGGGKGWKKRGHKKGMMDRALRGPNAGGGAGVLQEKLHRSALRVCTGGWKQGSGGGSGKNRWRKWRVEEQGERRPWRERKVNGIGEWQGSEEEVEREETAD